MGSGGKVTAAVKDCRWKLADNAACLRALLLTAEARAALRTIRGEHDAQDR